MSDLDEKDTLLDKTTRTEQNFPAIESQRVKLPPFWTSNPSVWFAQTEAQFAVCQISADSTKYFHVVASLPQEICESVMELITNPPVKDKYGTLKTALISRHTLSEERRLEKLLERAELGDRKPSEVFWSMKTLAGQSIDPRLVKTLWFRKLPQVIYVALTAMGDKPIDDLLTIADKIHEATTPSVSTISPNPSNSRASVDSTPNEFEVRLARIESMLSEMSTGRSRSPYYRAQSRSPYRRPRSDSRRRFNDNSVCYYHQQFGSAARKCRKPCTFHRNEPVSTSNSKKE